MKFVEGSYPTSQEAFAVVERLQAEGYKKDAIRLVSNTTTKNTFMDQPDMDITTDDSYTQTTNHRTDDDRSMWEKIKDAFSAEDYEENNSIHSEDDVLYNYQDDIANGNIVVVVEGGPYDKIMDTDNNRDTLNTLNRMTNDEETIKLQEERLDVDTEKVQTGEVNVSKRIIEEKKTIEVPIEHEEIVIQRHKVTNGTHSDGDMTDEEIVIPVSEEQIHVTKEPVVTEEVTIGKKIVEGTKHVSETVRKEGLDVTTDGDIDVHDDII